MFFVQDFCFFLYVLHVVCVWVCVIYCVCACTHTHIPKKESEDTRYLHLFLSALLLNDNQNDIDFQGFTMLGLHTSTPCLTSSCDFRPEHKFYPLCLHGKCLYPLSHISSPFIQIPPMIYSL